MNTPGLSPHVEACVRSRDLARVVGEVLGRVPRPVEGEHQAVPLVAVDGSPLPQVQTIGPWTEPVSVGGSMVRAAAVRAKVARDLAATHSRSLAVKLASDPPTGCSWALFYETNGCAVLCTRTLPRSGAGGAAANTPTTPEAA